MISDHTEGHSSFAPVRIIPYTVRPIRPKSNSMRITQIGSMVVSGHNHCRWNQSPPPSASHLCTKLGIAFWMSGHCCRLALDESQPCKLYSATLGRYLPVYCQRTLANQSLVACCLSFPSSTPPEPRLHISSEPSQPIFSESIRHY
jgi:hypothetical protein